MDAVAIDRSRAWIPPLITGGAVAACSALVRIGYDEAYWLAIARMVTGGRTLYVDAIDNKTPFTYLVLGTIDALPGPFAAVRGIVVGLLVAWVVWASGRLLEGPSHRGRWIVPVTVGVTAALQAELNVTIELLAVSLLFGALVLIRRSGRFGVGTLVALLAPAFDLRAVLLLPGIVAAVGERHGPRRRRTMGLVAGVVVMVSVATVVLVPDLRYGLIEMNFGTRSLQRPPLGDIARAASISLLPGAALLPRLSWSRAARSDRMLLLGGFIVGAMSLLPFEHYWTYVLLAIPGMAVRPAPRRAAMALPAVVAVALIPLGVNTVDEARIQSAEVPSYREATDQLDGVPFLYVGARPYLTTWQPGATLLRAPTMIYLVADTSRTVEQRAELPRLLDEAEALADDGILDLQVSDLPPDQQEILVPISERLEEFSCVRRIGDVILRFRPEACPASR